ncbi:uncharacterized protein LOC143610277 [Bidens hawaiensis]|uniref:uncharacterized protein LOC143610277 n=1 Tax=Bidens hawaiensis TaxID=980011 RepID=UPI00404A53D9
MATNLVHGVNHHHHQMPRQQCCTSRHKPTSMQHVNNNMVAPPSCRKHSITPLLPKRIRVQKTRAVNKFNINKISASLDLTEENVKLVLNDARSKFSHIFDTEVGMTGVAELAEVDGPFVKIRLKGRFWHERSLVLARLGNYLKERIPEILEVDIEDEKQLDDSPENF